MGASAEPEEQVEDDNKSFSFLPPAGVCGTPRECPAHQISFYIHSGAANVVPAAICVQNKL